MAQVVPQLYIYLPVYSLSIAWTTWQCLQLLNWPQVLRFWGGSYQTRMGSSVTHWENKEWSPTTFMLQMTNSKLYLKPCDWCRPAPCPLTLHMGFLSSLSIYQDLLMSILFPATLFEVFTWINAAGALIDLTFWGADICSILLHIVRIFCLMSHDMWVSPWSWPHILC